MLHQHQTFAIKPAKLITAGTICLFLWSYAIQAAPLSFNQQLIHQQERQKALEEQLAPEIPDVRLSQPVKTYSWLVFPEESPCFNINQVELLGQETVPKWLRLKYLAAQGEGHCLGGEGINLLMSALQNRLIDHGYVTTRILAPEQDLNSGRLQLLILPGKVRHISTTAESDKHIWLYSPLPSREGQLLDLRDIEQGLENLQRIPNATASINLMPGDEPGESDLVVSWQQKRFWRLGASLDDSGTVSTGRYQGGLTFYLDNLTAMGDMLYLSGGHDVQARTKRGTRNYTANYSIPYGYWALSLTASGSDYHQTVAGSYEDYEYSGDSTNLNARLSRILHRNDSHKTSFYYDLMNRQSRNYVNDTEVEIQRRATSAWKLGLQHRHYLPANVTLNADLSYQHGTRWFGAQPAPEEETGDATALSKIIRFSASLDIPFSLKGQNFSYSPSFQRQLARESLTPQDRFSIGGRWSVRGFDGELSLSADNGWYLRNDLAWASPLKGQQLYIGVDYGEVGGTNSEYLLGKHLAGGALGLRGYIPAIRLSYDTFAGIPISKPDGFITSPVTLGFNLNWEY